MAVDLGWLAGIIDGEGCITLLPAYKRETVWYRPYVKISNTNPLIIDRISKISKALKVGHWISRRMKGKYADKNLYEVVFDGMKRVNSLLNIMLPFIVGKKDEAETVKAFIDYRSNKHGGNNTQYPYGEIEKGFYEKCKQQKQSVHLRDLMPNTSYYGVKIKSELLGDLQTETEMSSEIIAR